MTGNEPFDGFRIYRKELSRLKPHWFKIVDDNTGSTETHYIDTEVKPGNTYMYRIMYRIAGMNDGVKRRVVQPGFAQQIEFVRE